jgi:hypothetical protein
LLPKYLQVREARFSRIGQTILFGALLLAPHFLYSLSTTKSLFGILQLAGKAAHRVYLGEGLVHYLQLLPKGIGGWPLGITAILGICILILLILSPMREKYLGLTWTGCIGFTALFLTGLLVHAEPRYVILPMTLLSGTGIGGTFYLLGRYSRSIAALFLGTIYMACAWFGVLHYRELNAVFVTESTSSFNNAYREALLAIRANTGDSPCAVWSGLNKPRASWYARCITERDSSKETVTIETASHPEMTFYSVTSTRYADDTELSEDLMSSYGLFMTEIFRKDDPSTYGTMRVYRISKR